MFTITSKDFAVWSRRLEISLESINKDDLFVVIEHLITYEHNYVNRKILSITEKSEIAKHYRELNGNNEYKYHYGRLADKLLESMAMVECLLNIAHEYSQRSNVNTKTTWENLIRELKEFKKILQPEPKPDYQARDFAAAWAKVGKDYERVRADTPINELKKLRRGSVLMLIIVNEHDIPMGVITETDLRNISSDKRTASDIAVQTIITFQEDDLMELVYNRLHENNSSPRIGQVVVVQKDGKLLGVVSVEEARCWKDGETPE